MKWLNTPVKSTEYKKDKEKVELEIDEPVTIKDLIPERDDKDLEQVKAFLVGCLEMVYVVIPWTYLVILFILILVIPECMFVIKLHAA